MFFKSGSLRDCLHFNFLYLVIINGLYDNTREANIKKYRFLFTFAEYETASVESEAFYFPTPP